MLKMNLIYLLLTYAGLQYLVAGNIIFPFKDYQNAGVLL